MCAKQSLRQPAGESPAPGKTIRSGYHNWRASPRGDARSPVRNDAGRNALSGVKVSSPVKLNVPEWPSYYTDAKASLVGSIPTGTLGVQVHGMYRRLSQELGRSPSAYSLKSTNFSQEVEFKCKVMRRREVRWFRSSEEVE